MFLVVKRKTLVIIISIVLVAVLLGGVLAIFGSVQKTLAFSKKVIVLDAGHGGVDKGVTGVNGTVESQKNLEITLRLGEMLSDLGFLIVYTRKDDRELVGDGDTRKGRDFNERKKIVEENNPDMVISIHCNKYPTENRRGIQVFYNQFNKKGKNLAKILQDGLNGLNSKYVGRNFSALKGDYFMLNCTEKPSVIIETGFLSNVDDEKLLNDSEYLNKLCYAITDGVIRYFE